MIFILKIEIEIDTEVLGLLIILNCFVIRKDKELYGFLLEISKAT